MLSDSPRSSFDRRIGSCPRTVHSTQCCACLYLCLASDDWNSVLLCFVATLPQQVVDRCAASVSGTSTVARRLRQERWRLRGYRNTNPSKVGRVARSLCGVCSSRRAAACRKQAEPSCIRVHSTRELGSQTGTMDEQVANLAQVQALTQQAMQQEAVLQQQETVYNFEALRNADVQRIIDLRGLLAVQRSRVFVDVKGIGKPSFSSEPRQFGAWALKVGNLLEGVLSGRQRLSGHKSKTLWITNVAPISGFLEAGAEPAVASRQLYSVFAHLYDGDALHLIQNAADSDGWEAWRVLTRRLHPQGTDRDAPIMSQLLEARSFDPKISTLRWRSGKGKSRPTRSDPPCRFPMTSRAASSLR